MNDVEMKATRQAFGEALTELAAERDDIIAVTADLAESLRMLKVRDDYPDRFLDVGVAEANMAGISAGLAMMGYVPVAATFAVFLTRAYDHIRMQICQNNVHAIMVGSHGGVSNALDGGSANALEDIAYMRALPNMTVVFPSDANEAAQALRAVVDADGPVYLRLYREPTPVFTDPSKPFEIGKAHVVREGEDVSLIATGPHVAFALEAAQQLESEGTSAEVVAVPTIQPLDTKTIVASAEKTGRVVTAEDHSVHGGLGSAVAEALSEEHPTPLRRVAVRQFGESGPYYELIKKINIDSGAIVAAAKELL